MKSQLCQSHERTIHRPGTGNFRCACGERLSFGTVRGAMTLLLDQRREGNQKFGNCPKCRHLHVIGMPEKIEKRT